MGTLRHYSLSQVSKSSFVRFVLVGASATLLHYLLMGFMIALLDFSPVTSSAVGYIISALYNYWANSIFSFSGIRSHGRSFPRFVVVALAGLGVNQMFLSIGIYFTFPISISQFFATTFVFIWNYLANSIWTFNK